MSHLDPERLAALADETPTPMESAHLTQCMVCSAELSAQRRLVRMAAAAGPVSEGPSSRFDALVPRLKAEGLIVRPVAASRGVRWTVRAAASITLLAAGAVAGRMSAPRGSLLGEAGAPGGSATAAGARPADAFQSSDDAVRALALSQQTYTNAAAYLAAQDSTSHFIGLNENSYRTRLNALDDILAATRAALYQAPQDPVLNQYYQGTLSARQTTLAQLRGVTPVALRKGSY